MPVLKANALETQAFTTDKLWFWSITEICDLEQRSLSLPNNDEKKSAETFVTAANGKRYVITGDMARHNADGTITMLGRGSLCINSGGEKIYPEEVEMAIKAHPDVFDTLVAATPDDRFGQCVTALIELRPDADEPDLAAIQEACKTHIARYKVPRRIYFVDKVRRAPSGKADYRWAKETAMARYNADSLVK